jgi:exopolyphosphatase/pppGpp-phosphohydrolase
MKTTIPDNIRQLALESYLVVRQKYPENVSVTVLHIGDEYTFIAQGIDSLKPDNLWMFDIGTDRTAHDFFKQFPPAPGEVENAIQVVEDEVMPLHKLLIPNSNLYTLDEKIREIAVLAVFKEYKPGMILERTDMERVFNRLAAIISGRPASQDVLPTATTFASTILILREVMHHLGFPDITLLSR